MGGESPCAGGSKARHMNSAERPLPCAKGLGSVLADFRAAESADRPVEGSRSWVVSLPCFGFSSPPSSCLCWWISLCCSSITASSFACWSSSCLCCTCCSLMTCSSTAWSSSFACPASGKDKTHTEIKPKLHDSNLSLETTRTVGQTDTETLTRHTRYRH